jgi:REP element-mobilizing transposase RayT
MKPIREKKHRLDSEIYKGERPVSFTLCIKDKKRFFIDGNRYKKFSGILLNELRNFNCSAYVYVFMPDHMHLTLAGNDSKSDVKKCLEMFKQKTGYWLGKNFPVIKWQKDYYDHILRKKENLNIHIKYILNNPVRAGLVDYWKQYPYKGSTLYNLENWD